MKRFQFWILGVMMSLLVAWPVHAVTDVTRSELKTFATNVGNDTQFGMPQVESTENGVLLSYGNGDPRLELTAFLNPEAALDYYEPVYGNSAWVEGDGFVFYRNGNVGYRAESESHSTTELRALIEGRVRYLSVLFPPRLFDYQLSSSTPQVLLGKGADLASNGELSFDFYFDSGRDDAGFLLDSRGAQTPDAGDVSIRLEEDGRLSLSFYAPLYEGICGVRGGFLGFTTETGAEAGTWNHLELQTGISGFRFSLNGHDEMACALEQGLDDGPVYLGLHPKAAGGSSVFKGYVRDYADYFSMTSWGEPVDTALARQTFLDLTSSDADASAFRFLKERGVMMGSQGYVEPNAILNRAGMVKILLKAYGVTIGGAEEPFLDVNGGDWFAPYVATAYSRGIVKGVDAAHFAPARSVTRGEFYTMLARTNGGIWTYVKGYKDVSPSDWFANGAAFALNNGLHKNDHFDATTWVSRREAARALTMLLKNR